MASLIQKSQTIIEYNLKTIIAYLLPNMMCFNSFPFITVIIPTFNDLKSLKKCLESLKQQTYPQKCFEIIIVDNGSQEKPISIVNSADNVRLLFEKCPGSYAARNKGISEAIGDILAFTDSDTIPDVNWLERGANLFCNTHNCGFIAGKIEVFSKEPHNPNLIERYEKMVSHRQKDYVMKHKFGATANLFTSKKVFKEVGLFNASLKSRGDLEWGQKVASSSYEILYTDEAVVRHPARRRLRELFQRNVRLAGGRVDHRRQLQTPLISTRYIVNLLLPPFKELAKAFLQSNRDNKLHHQIALLGIIIFVHYVSSIETLRVLIGGKSIR